ncbi:EamA family transporter RarD [Pseudomonas sp. F1_0610]|uniref:EamA family transporter RarD n=1 Tax=Pseudomonas sp. F1_0610 TaxID=3114284 RepID=UPI0039C350F1
MRLSGRGVGMSLFSSLMFALIPSYALLLAPLDGIQVFAQRLLWSLPVLLALVVITGHWRKFLLCLRQLKRRPILTLGLLASASILGSQWFLFVWSPLNGHMLDITLGYFLMPLVLVLVGRVFYQERLRALQKIAVLLAVIGCVHELFALGAISWVTVVTMFGYPPYFMLRRWMKFDAFSGFFLEMLVLAPVAITLMYLYGDTFSLIQVQPWLIPLLLGMGILSSFAFAAMIAASRLLPLGVLGILSYIEPVLLFLSSIFIVGEAVTSQQWWTYIPIWLAVVLVMFDSVRLLYKQAQRGY